LSGKSDHLVVKARRRAETLSLRLERHRHLEVALRVLLDNLPIAALESEWVKRGQKGPENENPLRNILVQCLSVWVFELELVNVANVKTSSSNVANFQLGIGIGFGNISTLATFTSVGVGEWKSTID